MLNAFRESPCNLWVLSPSYKSGESYYNVPTIREIQLNTSRVYNCLLEGMVAYEN